METDIKSKRDHLYVSLSIQDSSVFKNILDEFLKRACEIAKGDTNKSINVDEIWDDSFPFHSLERDATIPLVLKSLKAGNLVSDGKSKDEVKVTLNGIYYVIDNLNVTPENIGAISRSDVKEYGSRFLQIIYDLTNGDPSRSVGIDDIKNRLRGISGTIPYVQLAKYLKTKGLIDIDGDDMNRFKVPSKEIKKYYPPPPPPSP